MTYQCRGCDGTCCTGIGSDPCTCPPPAMRGGETSGEGEVDMADGKATMREIHLMAAAAELANLMYRWNVIDEYDLVIEDSRKGSPYHHVTTALEKILQKLGIDASGKMDFYDMVTTGMTPAEAVQRIKEFRQSC